MSLFTVMVLWRLLRARLIAARSLAPGLVFLLASCAAQTLPPVAPTRLATSGAPPPYIFQNVPASFRIDAAAAYVVESQTDTVLYEYNSDARIQPGSLAKLMTLYLVLDAIDEQRISLDSRVTITEDVAQLAKDPAVSLMFLRQGQQVPVRDLLYGMMVSSGCDAALALANAVGGNSVTFVIAMNARARRLGMTNTNFATPNGLPVPGQVTTAHDMAILALAVIKQHPEAFVYTSRRSYEFNRIRQRNTNGLLFIDPRVNGLKTGHVREAGFHLLASAKSEDLQLVSLVLGTQSHTRRTLESELLLNWAFDAFITVTPDWHTALPASLPVHRGEVAAVAIAPIRSPELTVVQSDKTNVHLHADLDHDLSAPVRIGQIVGKLIVSCNGREISIPVETTGAVALSVALESSAGVHLAAR
jgi:D-alanyl-D-alanine carboxypeptidase (penicillin-binding protein 5/6)